MFNKINIKGIPEEHLGWTCIKFTLTTITKEDWTIVRLWT